VAEEAKLMKTVKDIIPGILLIRVMGWCSDRRFTPGGFILKSIPDQWIAIDRVIGW
jgi:hypothetical protein